MIDPAELHRVYPPASMRPVRTEPMTHDVSADEVAALRRELALLTAEREREREQLQARIDDLSRRLDAEGEERRRLTAILTDQRAKQQPVPDVIAMPPPSAPAETPPPVPAKEMGWFRRVMGGR